MGRSDPRARRAVPRPARGIRPGRDPVHVGHDRAAEGRDVDARERARQRSRAARAVADTPALGAAPDDVREPRRADHAAAAGDDEHRAPALRYGALRVADRGTATYVAPHGAGADPAA